MKTIITIISATIILAGGAFAAPIKQPHSGGCVVVGSVVKYW